jgi:hypothetical protein
VTVQMCLDDAFRLCSCDADSLTPAEIGWVLEVVDPSKPRNTKKGKLKVPSWASAELMTVENVLAQLNSGTCCDFEVESAQQYYLKICVPSSTSDKTWFEFSFIAGRWNHHQNSAKFAPWRTQLVPCRQGTVEPAHVSCAAASSSSSSSNSGAAAGTS